MKKTSLILWGFFIALNLYAEEQNLQNQQDNVQNTHNVQSMQNIDKLDALDQQSKEFFKAITGLEKDYLEEQVAAIKNKSVQNSPNQNPNQPQTLVKEEIKLSQEDYEKNVFTHQNEMARLTTDFTRTKKLKDLKIKSMYSFNGKDYVVLELIDETQKTTSTALKELSANIEGRYIEGDNILGHKIIDINTRTKSMELYKKLDEEYGYTIYLSNYGISVSDLKKISKAEDEKVKTDEKAKKEEPKAEIKAEQKNEVKDEFKVKKAFEQVNSEKNTSVKQEIPNCLYTVKKQNLNVRNETKINAKILRILKINDQFTINQKNNDWVEINTIYKKISGDVMDVSTQNNWVQIIDESVSVTDKNCM